MENEYRTEFAEQGYLGLPIDIVASNKSNYAKINESNNTEQLNVNSDNCSQIMNKNSELNAPKLIKDNVSTENRRAERPRRMTRPPDKLNLQF